MWCAQCNTINTAESGRCRACAAPFGVVVEAAANPYAVPAGLLRRAFAGVLDCAILVLLSATVAQLLVMFVVPVELLLDRAWPYKLGSWTGVVTSWLYSAGLESAPQQATLGKQLLRIQVCNTRGERIGFMRASLRHFCKGLSFMTLGLGWLIIPFTKRRQAAHDLASHCIVLRSAGR